MPCACGRKKNNAQTSAQQAGASTVTGFGEGDGVAAAQQSAQNSISNTSRVRRG